MWANFIGKNRKIFMEKNKSEIFLWYMVWSKIKNPFHELTKNYEDHRITNLTNNNTKILQKTIYEYKNNTMNIMKKRNNKNQNKKYKNLLI